MNETLRAYITTC